MADSYNKKEREKKRRKKKQDKREKKNQRKLEGKTSQEFMYVDENGNLTATPPTTPKTEIKAEDIQLGVPKHDEMSASDPNRKGRVKFFNVDKGYGFIVDSATKESYFVHANNADGELNQDDKVEFEIGNGPKGPIAINVRKK